LEKKVKLAAEKGGVGLIEVDLSDLTQPSERRRRMERLRPGACPAGFIVMRAKLGFVDDVFYLARKSWRDAASKILRLKKPHSFLINASVEMEAHFIQEERKAVNVIGLLPGRDPELKNEYILLGGHLDHLGVGLDGFIYPGADDNAASAAAILETIRVLGASGFSPRRSIVFASWG
jgi:hypothetical protein